jgi:hypothetical protein
MAALGLLLVPPPGGSGLLGSNASRAPTLAGSVTIRTLRVLVIGRTGGVGLETVNLSLASCHRVTCMARHAAVIPSSHEHLRFVQGDITDAIAVRSAVIGQDAVVTSISLRPYRAAVEALSSGARIVLAALRAAGVSRLIVVTGRGAGDSRGHGGFAYDHVLQPLWLGSMYRDKAREDLGDPPQRRRLDPGAALLSHERIRTASLRLGNKSLGRAQRFGYPRGRRPLHRRRVRKPAQRARRRHALQLATSLRRTDRDSER